MRWIIVILCFAGCGTGEENVEQTACEIAVDALDQKIREATADLEYQCFAVECWVNDKGYPVGTECHDPMYFRTEECLGDDRVKAENWIAGISGPVWGSSAYLDWCKSHSPCANAARVKIASIYPTCEEDRCGCNASINVATCTGTDLQDAIECLADEATCAADYVASLGC